jgi:hypothetical protein
MTVEMPKMDLTRSRQEQLNEVYKAREEMLVTELLGETVKVRGLGYKTMRRAKVDVREVYKHRKEGPGPRQPTGEFKPVFLYESDDRQQAVALMPRLDVMTPEGWATVWDDGAEDVFDGELASSAKPTGRKYRTGML